MQFTYRGPFAEAQAAAVLLGVALPEEATDSADGLSHLAGWAHVLNAVATELGAYVERPRESGARLGLNEGDRFIVHGEPSADVPGTTPDRMQDARPTANRQRAVQAVVTLVNHEDKTVELLLTPELSPAGLADLKRHDGATLSLTLRNAATDAATWEARLLGLRFRGGHEDPDLGL